MELQRQLDFPTDAEKQRNKEVYNHQFRADQV